MKYGTLVLLGLMIMVNVHEAMGQGSPSTLPAVVYPETRKVEQVDDYHGTRIADPYRWLEDPDSENTEAWVESQNEVTQAFFETIQSRESIRERLGELWNYAKFGLPEKRAGRYFYEANDGLQNQALLYVSEGLNAKGRLLLDPNELAEDGTVDLASWEVSPNGKLVALAFASAGSDWREWRVLEVDSGEMLEDHVLWSKFSGASWAEDSTGFYYSRYAEPGEGETFTAANYFHKVYYHQVGTTQAADRLIYERSDEKEWGFDAQVTDDGRYLAMTVWKGTLSQNQFFYLDLEGSRGVVELLTGFEAEYLFVGNEGSQFYFLTDHQAPMRRLIAIDVERPKPENWQEVVPEAEVVAQSVNLVGSHFLISYLKDAQSVVKVYGLDGGWIRDVEFPGIGSASGFAGRPDDPETFYSFQNFTTPSTIFQYNAETGKSQVFKQAEVAFDPSQFETRQVFYESKDGTRVPMFITVKKGLKLDGNRPTLLYGYGGFDISITPRFSVTNLAWVERGGVYAVANLRGGGEYGRDWHEGGMLDKKQNVFDDFIAAAEWLIDHDYTCPKKLGIHGRSNGGLLVGAVMCQRPDLFAAAVPGVGVMDMLRFHRFTIGYAWTSEYGCSDDAEQFKTLVAYSPVHNLKSETRYPATMVMTADHDDRVVPAHSHKFAATLQDCQADDGPPCLIRIETSGGHGAGKPTAMQIAESTDLLAFLSKALGVDE
ncbi:MAG: prolyl oligopeptidase family serine peptidase [Pirellulaceae bacterium]|nr:prolyl oligopeptidase family serine peptidase [Pirellulaceae bacterium]